MLCRQQRELVLLTNLLASPWLKPGSFSEVLVIGKMVPSR